MIGDESQDVLRAVLTCRECGGKTVFEMTDNVVTFRPGKLFTEDLDMNLSDDIQRLFNEAVLSFYGSAYGAVVAMCRSAVEEALKSKNVDGRSLFEQVNNAPPSFMGDDEKAIAHGARLIGRNALHHTMVVSPAQASTMLTATIDLLNYIAKQPEL